MQGTEITRLFFLMIILLLPARQVMGEDVIRYKFDRSVYVDNKGTGLKQPEGVACGHDRLAVADTGNGRLVIYSLEQGEPREGREIRMPQIVYPIRVAGTSKGDLLVLDGRLRKVARLSSDGAFKDYVDMAGVEGVVMPAGISIDAGDNLYVLDVPGGRVLVFGDDGKFQRQLNLPKEYGFITDVAVDSKGAVFLVDSVGALLFSNVNDPAVFEPYNKGLKEEMKFASNIMVDDKGVVYITDQNGGGIVMAGRDGANRRLFSMGWKEGTLRYPAQVCVSKDGELFVADRANSRIQKFAPLK